MARKRTKARARLAPATQEAAAVRARVLDTCRRLFNRKGTASVTTAAIAEALGMNEGLLHYYFNTKEQIFLALFDEFEQGLAEASAHGFDQREQNDRYAGYLQNWFRVMWRYRFFYRDYRGTHRIMPSLRARLAEIHASGHRRIREVLGDMAAIGLLQADATEREALLVNGWIVFTYWIDYLAVLRGSDRLGKADLEQGLRQIESLYTPYLTPLGRAQRLTAPRLADILTP